MSTIAKSHDALLRKTFWPYPDICYTKRMQTVLVFRSVHWDCWSVKLDALATASERRGWRLQLIDQDFSVAIKDLLDFWHPVGVVVVESGPATASLPPKIFGKTPVVYLDPEPNFFKERFAYVHHDARAIVCDAIREFISIGCEHFAYVGWPEKVHWSQDKQSEFRKIMSMHGRTLHEFCPDKKPSDQSRNVVTTFNRIKSLTRFLRALPTPCGILAVNDIIAWQVLSAAQAAGRAVPDELAVIGVDNDPIICEQTKPTLSSFELDFAGAGEEVMRLIEGWSPSQRPCRHVKPLHLVRRQSTRRLSVQDSNVELALERIRKEACSGISAQSLFADFTCSRRMAEIRFRKATGTSFQREIERVRIEKACELLRRKKNKLDAIADMCGFRSLSLFFRQFKAHVGVTPLQWATGLSTHS